MIDRIRMVNFKCFEEQTVSLGHLTVLAGLNGAGKSSVMQALLLLRQSGLRADGAPDALRWRGELVDLGSFRDVLFEGADRDRIELEAVFHSAESVGVEVGVDDAGRPDVIRRTGFAGAPDSSLYRRSMFYLMADRLGPQRTLPFWDRQQEAGTPLGRRGEDVLWFLGGNRGDVAVPKPLRYDDTLKGTLFTQAVAWLGVVSPGVDLRIDSMPKADLAAAGFAFSQAGDVATRVFRAVNVGFGLSYALPLIVALLSVRGDDLVMMENPEAHLHPGGQTRVAELAARAAATGAQVVLETHSDHVLDGIRLAVRNAVIPPDKVSLHYFCRDDLKVRVRTPVINRNGRLDSWPEGFFDQHERNLAALVVPRSE